MKSPELTAVPRGVLTVLLPEPASDGTDVVREVEVAAVIVVAVILKLVRSFGGRGSKFVPLIVTDVPARPIAGVNPVIVGVRLATVNAVALVAEPPGAVTPMVPVVAPAGTVTINFDELALETVAAVPLNVTVS